MRPQFTPWNNMKTILTKIYSMMSAVQEVFKKHKTVLIFLLALSIAGMLHGYNMFHYPYYESDEGTYMSQAFAVKEHGELSLYVYWYDHPPFGWITIASWIELLHGNWNTFGNSLNTGRMLMYLLHLIQVTLIFFLVHRVSRSPWLAFLAILLYSTSPLTMYFQRRILLDNLLVTWLLLSVSILYMKEVKLRHVLMSGVFYGLATITKVTTVMFGFPILYILLTAKWGIHKGFRTLGWLISAGSVVSLWIFYAMIKTEFIPAPNNERVSLIGSLKFQADRGTGAYFWEANSSFMDNIYNWMILDASYIYILGFALLCAIVVTIFSKRYRFFGLASLFYTFFLIRGGVVIGFYVLPLVPFAVISIIGALQIFKTHVLDRFRLPQYVISGLFVLIVLAYSLHYAPKITKYLTVDETSNQMEALRWIKKNIPEDARILVDIYGMTELLDPTFVNDKVFNNADWYFKVAKDPEIRYTKYRDDWRNFDYVLVSHEMLYQSYLHQLPVVHDAIRNSEPLIKWVDGSTAYIDVQKFISTNGDWAALHRVNSNSRTQLLFAWNHYVDNFIDSYGEVVDRQNDVTTSEGQSYAMLRAVLMNDREAFKGIWLWTKHHLQHRLGDSLISWRWKDGKQTDSANATDADIDIALALIFASVKFENPEYLEDAKEIIEDIWKQTVVSINGSYYLLPSERTLAGRGEYYLLNPSYFSPAHYRIFAEVDTERSEEWLKLASDSYRTLNRLRTWQTPGAGLPPNWVLVHQRTGSLESAGAYILQGGANYFGYDAFRTLWRVALDASWFDTEASTTYLNRIGVFFEQEWLARRGFADVYLVTGERVSFNQSPAVASGILSAMKISSDSQISSDVYNTLFVEELVLDEESEYAYWGDPENYYNANWVWFGMALFNDNLPNIWALQQ